MNAPLPESIRRALETVTLDDKYALESGRAFMSGVQALVRLPMLQKKRDAMNGLNTAGFVSGYRGSPLGGYDQALWQAKKHLAAQDIVFQPGVNEELAATAVWGSQMLDLYPQSKKFDGVFGIWYGKGPGVDRSGDALKHGNAYGSSPHGGVLVVAGDDHGCVSSSMPHQSDVAFMSWFMPTLHPAGVAEYLEFGEYGYALSRFSGMWVGFKAVSEIVESGVSVALRPDRRFATPEFTPPSGGLHYRWPDLPGPPGRRDERGLSSSTQLAVVLPLLMLLTLGIVEAGLWLHARNVAQRAATAAVDVARGSYGTAGEGEQRARDLAGAAGLTDVVVRVDRGPQRVSAVVSARATLVLDLGLGRIEETAAGPRERVSTP